MNVLLYVMDALRADHLSCYGYERDTSPALDRLAAEGTRFSACFSPATWTRPVAASLLTGLYPPAHGTRTRHDTLGESVPTIAESFAAAGYDTYGVTSMGNVSGATGFDDGFDRFSDLYKREDIIEKRSTSTATEEELTGQEGAIALPRAEDITREFETLLEDRDSENPFFGFCWSIEPHIPYDPPDDAVRFRDEAYDGPVDGSRESLKRVDSERDLEQLEALYDEEVRYNDDCLGSLLDALEAAGELEETLICVVGDHGDAFEEHGRLTHGHAPYDELVHVPWIVRPPAGGDGVVASELASLVDVTPTVLDSAGLPIPDHPSTVAGDSLAPALEGRPVEGHDRVYFETRSYDMQNAFYGVRTTDWKYMRIEQPDVKASTALDLARYVLEKGLVIDILRHPRHYWQRYRYDDRERLYDLAADPGENDNVARSDPDRAAELESELDEWLAACEEYRDVTDDRRAEIDDRTKEQLRELGYTE